MAITGKVRTLFTDKTQSEALFPKTKVSAISDENGVGLDSILSEMIYTGDVVEDATGIVNADTLGGRPASDFPTANEVIYTGENEDTDLVPLNADTLGGIPADEYATENFVAVKIAEAQIGGGSGDIDLSGYATKDDVSNAVRAIDFPVDSVNGKTGAVTLSASDVSAVPTTRTVNGKALSSNISLSASDVGALSTNGGAVGGHINMGDQFTVYGLIDPISPHDAMTKRYADVNYAPASHKHDSRYLRRYELNRINIDNTDGNWEVDISGRSNGTVPADWVNVTQYSSGHFLTQIAKQCQTSTNTARKDSGLWYRERYAGNSTPWSAWSKIYHEGTKPTASEIGAAAMKLLWQNASPNSAFAAQKIYISNMSKYKYFLIQCSNGGSLVLENNGKSVDAFYLYGSGSTIEFAHKSMSAHGDGISVGNTYFMTVNNSNVWIAGDTERNGVLIPQSIYGIG